MNGAHFHLLVNHFPIIGTITGLLVVAFGIVLSQSLVKRTGYIILVGAALFALPAYFSGEGAEEAVEHQAGVDEGFIEAHEDIAKTYLLFAIGQGILAALAFLLDWRKHNMAGAAGIVVGLYAAATLLFLFPLGRSGGEIRHPEIRAANAAGNAGGGGETGGEHGDDD